MKCIYDIPSQNQKSHLQKSDEHVFPQVIGGFAVIKNVCKTCNDKLGIDLDSSFKKSIYIIKALNKLKLSTKKKIHRNVKLSFERNGQEIPAYFNNSDVLTGGVQDYKEFLEVPDSSSYSHIRNILEKKLNEHNCTSDFCEEDYINAPYDLHIPIMDSSKSLFLLSFVKRRGNEANLKISGLKGISFRAIGKIALNHYSRISADSGFHQSLTSFKDWIWDDALENRYVIDHAGILSIDPSDIDYQPFHYVRLDYVNDCVCAIIGLFGRLRYSVTLSDEMGSEEVEGILGYTVYDINNKTLCKVVPPDNVVCDDLEMLLINTNWYKSFK